MTRKWSKLLLPTLFVSLMAWGCDSVSETRLTGPSQGPDEVLVEYTLNGVKIVQETDATVGTVSGQFDAKGGVLMLGEHTLTIPEGAVRGATIFTMTQSTDALKFDLSATQKNSLLHNNVGAAGFYVPVKLSISYAGAGVSDPSVLKVVWLKLIGSETQPSSVDYGAKAIVGELSHFSRYALAWP